MVASSLTPTQRLARAEPLNRRQFGLTPTKCPVCSRSVYFVRPYSGGAVWFDDLGAPWPKHGCFKPPDGRTVMSAARFVQSLQKTSVSEAPKTQTLTEGLGPGVLVSNHDLVGLDLSDLDLSGAIFLNVSLSDTSLANCMLTDATLLRCVLSGSSLVGACLTGADLRGAVLDNADLLGANLNGADLRGASLVNVRFNRRTVLAGCDLTGVDISGAHCPVSTSPPDRLQGKAHDDASAWFPVVSKKGLLPKLHHPHPRNSKRGLCGAPIPRGTRPVIDVPVNATLCKACVRIHSRG